MWRWNSGTVQALSLGLSTGAVVTFWVGVLPSPVSDGSGLDEIETWARETLAGKARRYCLRVSAFEWSSRFAVVGMDGLLLRDGFSRHFVSYSQVDAVVMRGGLVVVQMKAGSELELFLDLAGPKRSIMKPNKGVRQEAVDAATLAFYDDLSTRLSEWIERSRSFLKLPVGDVSAREIADAIDNPSYRKPGISSEQMLDTAMCPTCPLDQRVRAVMALSCVVDPIVKDKLMALLAQSVDPAFHAAIRRERRLNRQFGR